METIKRQTKAEYGWLVVGESVGAGLLTAYRLYAHSVCDMNSAAAAAVCGLWRYTSVICLCLIWSTLLNNQRIYAKCGRECGNDNGKWETVPIVLTYFVPSGRKTALMNFHEDPNKNAAFFRHLQSTISFHLIMRLLVRNHG